MPTPRNVNQVVIKHQDYSGKDIAVGDKVLIALGGTRRESFTEAEVVRLGKKQVVVDYGERYNYNHPINGPTTVRYEVSVYPKAVIKI